MRAILLAAGRGSRMGHLTQDRPKCLVELGGHPLLDYQISALHAAGITEIWAVRGWRGECLEGRGLRLIDNPSWAQSNMVASLALADDLLRQGPCLVSYTDIFYTPEAPRTLVEAPACPLAITYDPAWQGLWTDRFGDPLADAETFQLNADQTVRDIGRKPTSLAEVNGQYMGLLRFTPDAWTLARKCRQALTDDAAARLDMTSLLRMLIDGGLPVTALPIHSPWGEADSADDLALYQARMAKPQPLPFTGFPSSCKGTP